MLGMALVAVRKAEAHGGVGKELLMRSGLIVGNHLWIRRLLDALFLTHRNLVNFTYCQGTWQR